MDNALHTDKISWLVCFFFFASELAQRRSSLCRNNIYCHHTEPLSSPAVHTLRTNSVTASPSLDSSPKVTLLLCPLAECATTAAPSGPPAHRHRQHRLLLSLLKFRTMLSVLQNLPPIATTSPWQLFNCIIYTKRLVCMGKYRCGQVSISSRADRYPIPVRGSMLPRLLGDTSPWVSGHRGAVLHTHTLHYWAATPTTLSPSFPSSTIF